MVVVSTALGDHGLAGVADEPGTVGHQQPRGQTLGHRHRAGQLGPDVVGGELLAPGLAAGHSGDGGVHELLLLVVPASGGGLAALDGGGEALSASWRACGSPGGLRHPVGHGAQLCGRLSLAALARLDVVRVHPVVVLHRGQVVGGAAGVVDRADLAVQLGTLGVRVRALGH